MTGGAAPDHGLAGAVAAENDRLADELHDHVIQPLFAVGLILQGILRTTSSPAVRARIDRSVSDLQGIVSDLRETILDLHDRQD